MGESELGAPVRNERRRSEGPLRILVADDDHDTVDTLASLLRGAGHIVQGVHSGAEVLPAARLFRPDALIVDLSLPRMSGYAVAQAILNSFTDLRRPLLIAISGLWTQTPDRMVAQQMGFDHHLEKPCDPAALLRLLQQSFRRTS